MFTGIKTCVSFIIEFILDSLGVRKTLEEGTVPIGLKLLSTMKISKNSSGRSLLSLR